MQKHRKTHKKAYIGLSIQELSKWGLLYIKTDDIYKDIAQDVESRFDTSNYGLDKTLSEWKHKQLD